MKSGSHNQRSTSSSRHDSETDSAGEWIVNRLLSSAGVEEHRSRFAARPALFIRGTEFFHLDALGLADVRLGRQRIRARIEELRSDERIEFRAAASEWIHVRFASRADAENVLLWAEAALGDGT